jgi:molybdate transport system substrate-binding protein
MKSRLAWLVVLGVAVILVAAYLVHPAAPSTVPLRLYAGAGLRPAVDKLAQAFQEQTGIRVEPDYSGSGLLLARATQDEQADLFMPGDAWYVDRLQSLASNVVERASLARLVPVLIVAKGNPKGVHGVADLARADLRVGLGDPKACQVGGVSTQILQRASVAPGAVHAQLALTVNELGIWVKMRNADAAIVWDATAAAIAADVERLTIPPDLRVDSEVVVARLAQSRQPGAARRFVQFARSEAGQAIFRAAGFGPPAP